MGLCCNGQQIRLRIITDETGKSGFESIYRWRKSLQAHYKNKMPHYRIKQTDSGYTLKFYEGNRHFNTFYRRKPEDVICQLVEGAEVEFIETKRAPRKKELERLVRAVQAKGHEVGILFKF